MTPHMGFEPPSALDLLTEFRKKFVGLAERRLLELRAAIDARSNEGPSHEMGRIYEEYDSLRHFENELNRVIQTFVIESVKPWQDALCRTQLCSLAQGFRTESAAGKQGSDSK